MILLRFIFRYGEELEERSIGEYIFPYKVQRGKRDYLPERHEVLLLAD